MLDLIDTIKYSVTLLKYLNFFNPVFPNLSYKKKSKMSPD